VTATGDPRSAGRLQSYGADQVIDHTATRLPQAVAGTFLGTIPGPVTARGGAPRSPKEKMT